MRASALCAALALLFVCSFAYATTTGSKLVPASDLVSLTITIHVGDVTSHKKIYCLNKTPGAARAQRGEMLFTSYAVTIGNLLAQSPVPNSLATYRQLNKVGKVSCADAARHPSPTPTPSSGGGHPNPTPTPKVPMLNFDSNGNLTSQGKANFGVPSNLSGNITAGASLYADYCTCHTPFWNENFSYVRNVISGPPASFNSTEITDPMLANIIAYLNQYNLDGN